MPYAPGIQDISGQLIAQGMSQAGAARARAIESLGESITGGIKTYQQNQIITNQALGKFGMGIQQDPEFKAYVQQVISDDPNAPQVPPALKKAFQNAASGKVDIYDAALLGTATDGYQQSKAARAAQQLQLLQGLKMMAEVQALTAKGNQPKYIMSQEELMKLYPQEKFDVSGVANVPGMPGMVDVSEMKISTRAPTPPQTPITIGPEGGTLVDPITGQTRIIGGIPRPGVGEMIVGGGIGAPAGIGQFSGQPQATAGLPAVVGQFARPTGSFAPQGGLMATGRPQTPVQAALPSVVPSQQAGAPAPAAQELPRVIKLPGSEAERVALEREQKSKLSLEQRFDEANRTIGFIDDVIADIDRIKEEKPLFEPVGRFPDVRRVLTKEGANFQAKLEPIKSTIQFKQLKELRESGTTLGQVAVRELDALQQTLGPLSTWQDVNSLRSSLVNKIRPEFVKASQRLGVLLRDFQAGRTEPSKEYYEMVGKSVAGPIKMNVSTGGAPGMSTLIKQNEDFSAFEGKLIEDADGNRFRIKNGIRIPIK